MHWMDQQKTILKKDQTTGTWLAGKVTLLVKFYYDLTMPDLADCADQEQFEYTITLQFEYTITLQFQCYNLIVNKFLSCNTVFSLKSTLGVYLIQKV